MSDLIPRLRRQLAIMAPHQKERVTSKLLLECVAELQKASDYIQEAKTAAGCVSGENLAERIREIRS